MAGALGSIAADCKALAAQLNFLKFVFGPRVHEGKLPAVRIRLLSYCHHQAASEIGKSVLNLSALEKDSNSAKGITLGEAAEIQIFAATPGNIEKSLRADKIRFAHIERLLEII